MIQYIIHIVGGIEGYGIVSVCLFVVVFSGALLWACFQNKPSMHSMGTMPLRDGETPVDEEGENHHD